MPAVRYPMPRLLVSSRSAARLAVSAALLALAACAAAPAAPPAADRTDTAAQSATEVVTATPAIGAEGARPSLSVTGATATTTVGTTSVIGCTGTAVALSADEKRSLDLHNQQRAASALPTFCVHPALLAAARAHSRDMLTKGYFSHTSIDGRTFVTRVVAAGYTGWRALAENIAWGSGSYGTPEHTFTSWLNSPGHRANIMNANLREIGIGVAAGTYRGYTGARMYTADFGTR